MKFIALAISLSFSAFAQFPKMPSVSGIKDISKQVLEACKEDKSKISGCESYTELTKLKACLMTNESKLSPGCKSSLMLVK
ncbi:MAG TPA: hypothetical protein VNJ08_06990 [Bacteriovoracaceae bacterium]|nr:hypothetical protein [Bacteriovoracaceae bacterium]